MYRITSGRRAPRPRVSPRAILTHPGYVFPGSRVVVRDTQPLSPSSLVFFFAARRDETRVVAHPTRNQFIARFSFSNCASILA